MIFPPSAVATAVNDNDWETSFGDPTKIYYIPVTDVEADSCVALEKGGKDPFGKWLEAYVAVHYNSAQSSYDYYFTFRDDAGYGMALTKSNNINAKGNDIVNPVPDVAKEGEITKQTAGLTYKNASDEVVPVEVVVLTASNGTCTK